MAININHSSDTFYSNSGVFIFGTGIVPIIEDAVYSSNFSGKYYGDGSSLTGLQAQFVNTVAEAFQDPYNNYFTKGSGTYFISNCENLSNAEKSNYSAIIQGVNNCFEMADHSIILNGLSNCILYSESSVLIGDGNQIYGGSNFISIGKNNINCNGGNRAVIGIDNNITNGSSVYVIGSGITLSSNVPSNTLYVNNLCTYDGVMYGNGSGITGLTLGFNTGDYITTGQTGVFGTLRLAESGSLVLGNGSSDQGQNNFLMHSVYSTIQYGAYQNSILGGRESIISGGAYNNLMVGGCCNRIAENVNNVAILGGCGIHALDSCTTYSTNFCASGGAFYGNGSGITGVVSSVNRCQVVAKNTTPFDICAVTRVASTYISNQNIIDAQGNGAFYLCDHNDNSNDDCILYTITNGFCAAQFSAMILGNAEYDGGTVFTTSMKIDGLVTCDGVVNQSKVIHGKAFPTDDACVVLCGSSLKIYITGSQTGMNWGTRMDILGMQGLD